MIHTYKLNGYFIALDVCSGAVHILDELSYDVLNLLDEYMTEECPQHVFDTLSKYSSEDIKSAYAELYSLYNDGLLFPGSILFDNKLYYPLFFCKAM